MKLCSNCGTPVPLVICPHCAGTHAMRGVAVGAVLLSLTACPEEDTGEVQALYGVSTVDADGDGAPEGSDCNDSNAAINPAAAEVAGDGVDSNCDCDDDT